VGGLLVSIQAIADEARRALADPELSREQLLTALAALVNENHEHLIALGVSHPVLEEIRSKTAAAPYGLSTKLTGAGGGGCAVTLVPDGALPCLRGCLPTDGAAQTSRRRGSMRSSASSRPRASRRTRRLSAGAGSACSRPRTHRARSRRHRTRRAGMRRRRCGRARRASSMCPARSSRSGRRSAGGGCSCEGSSYFWLLRDCRYKIRFFGT
jgi:hypothetical protein